MKALLRGPETLWGYEPVATEEMLEFSKKYGMTNNKDDAVFLMESRVQLYLDEQ